MTRIPSKVEIALTWLFVFLVSLMHAAFTAISVSFLFDDHQSTQSLFNGLGGLLFTSFILVIRNPGIESIKALCVGALFILASALIFNGFFFLKGFITEPTLLSLGIGFVSMFLFIFYALTLVIGLTVIILNDRSVSEYSHREEINEKMTENDSKESVATKYWLSAGLLAITASTLYLSLISINYYSPLRYEMYIAYTLPILSMMVFVACTLCIYCIINPRIIMNN